jgi:hypothetical protein
MKEIKFLFKEDLKPEKEKEILIAGIKMGAITTIVSDTADQNISKEFEDITLVDILTLFNFHGDEVKFICNEIINGLNDFKITIKSGCDDKKKKEIIKNIIHNWDEKGRELIDL